jgi:hypothetical protein
MSCPSCGKPPAAAPALGSVGTGARQTDGQAVASLVLGIAGLVVCPLVCSIIAIVLGNQAKARIAIDPSIEGEGMARAGVILGWVGVGIAGVFIVLWVLGAIFAFGTGGFG